MRLKSIELTNVRLIGKIPTKIVASESKNVLILLGNNGYGKTTFLDAIATAIAPYSSQYPGISDYQLSDLDVHINRYGKRAEYLVIDARLQYGNNEVVSIRYRKGVKNAPESNFKTLRQLALADKDAIINGTRNVSLPVFAYYGTGRGQFQVPERKRGFQKTYERWDCYRNALSPATDFKRFFGWFDLMEDEERRKKEEYRDFDYKLPVLEAVRNALSEFVHDYSNPKIKTHPLRFVMNRIEKDGETHELRIEQLSDGYKIVIAMVADLAARMAEANPDMSNPLHGFGVVLIDEVDLHIHPQWQRIIVRMLNKVFPNIQFIVTTHSPIIVVGASDIAQVVNLNDLDSLTENISDENIGQVLLSDLFGLKSLQSPIWDDSIFERDKLLAKTNLTVQENERLLDLDEKMAGLSSLLSSNSIRTFQLLKEIKEELSRQ